MDRSRQPESASTPTWAASTMLLAFVLVASLAISGCTLGEPDLLPTGDPIPGVTEPPSSVPTAPPEAPPTETAVTAIGEPAEAGGWRVVLLEAALPEAALPKATEPATTPRTLKVRVDVTNTSAEPLRITPGDFTLTAGTLSLFPEPGSGRDMALDTEVPPGGTESLAGAFDLSGIPIDAPLTLVFAPAEGDPARIEIRIEQP